MNTLAASLREKIVLLFIVAILASCATGQLRHEEGLALLDEGKTEEGLSKLQEAVKAEPDNVAYRASLSRNRAQVINNMLTVGNNERISGHPDAAQAAYLWVLKIDRNNPRAKDALAALEMDKRHSLIIAEVRDLIQKGDLNLARDALKPVFLENNEHAEALAIQRNIDELLAKEQSVGPSLTAKFKKPVTLEFRDANVKMVFEALSRTSGINVLLDKDVKPDLKTSIFVKDASVEDTIDLILLQNKLEKKILNDNTVFIYPNTPDKTKDYQDLKIRSFHLTNADPKQMLAMIKVLLKTKDVFVHEKTNSIVMRDTPGAIRLAERMIADQDIPDPEVMLEVEVLEISRSRLSEIGVKYPSQLSLTALQQLVPAAGANLPIGVGVPAATVGQLTLNSLKQINGSNIGISPSPSITLNALLQDSDTNILSSPRLRVRNREKAKIMIGDRVPVITNAITPVSTGTPVVTGNVQYLDVGLKLEVEPDIHIDNEVAIKVNMEVSSIVKEVSNSISGTLAYQIGTRNASTLLQLKDGETQILAGLVSKEERASANKVPGLGQLPILGHLFSSHGDNNTKTEIVLSITPHIVGRTKIPNAREVEYWSGTEATLRDSQLILKPLGASYAPALATRPPLPPPPTPIRENVSVIASPMVVSWQGPSQAKVGDKVSFTLSTQSAQGVNNLGLLLNFDPAVLRAVEVVEGNLAKLGNKPANFTKAINQTGGQVLLGLSGFNAEGGNVAGNVATVMFEVIGVAEQSQLTISRVTPTGTAGQELAYVTPLPHLLAVSP